MSVAVEKIIKTLKNRIYKYMTPIFGDEIR